MEFIMNDILEANATLIKEKIVEPIYSTDTEISVPLLVVFTEKKGPAIIPPVGVGDGAEFNEFLKHSAGELAHDRERIGSITAAFVVAEAWFTRQQKDEDFKKDYIRPSQDPNRKESLVIAGSNWKGETSFRSYEIEKTGGKRCLGEKMDGEAQIVSGRYNLNIFWREFILHSCE